MSEVANITAIIIAGLANIIAMVVGLATLWLKLKYRVANVEDKIRDNTFVTEQARNAVDKAVEHTEACDEDRAHVFKLLAEHDTRIIALEGQITILKVSVDSVSKNIDSTRHEMRGHMQTLGNKLDLVSVALVQKMVPTQPNSGT